jgi:hypothetical protein
MPRVGFEPTIAVFEREKIVRALDSVSTVIGRIFIVASIKSPVVVISSLNYDAIIHSQTKTAAINQKSSGNTERL